MTIQIPVLDDRSFDQLVAETRARIPVHTPEWTNLNESDPGVTLLELFAFLTENLLYRSNRIPEASRLKFLSMLGVSLQPPSPGTGLITVTNGKGPLAPPLALAAGTQLRSGPVPFVTSTPLAVLPVSSAVYVKQPQTGLDAATRERYKLIYQTFLESDTDVLTFYKPVSLDPPATGRPDPVVDLADPVSGTIDRSLWVALLAPPNASLDAVRRAIAGQTLSIGVYPATSTPGLVLTPHLTGSATLDPGLAFEIAAPEPDPSGQAGPGLGIGPARYATLPISYAEPVLTGPGLVQVTLPEYERILLWAFDPEVEGTGDFPPRLDDAAVAARLVTWIRVRYTPAQAGDDGTAGRADPVTGCGCGCDGGNDIATSVSPGALAAVGAGAPSGRITWVGVNAARAVQLAAVTAENVGTATGTPFQTFTLARTPVVTQDAPTGFRLELQDVDGTWRAWSEIDDIFAAAPSDTVFTLDRASGQITFGNGLSGLRPRAGAGIRASYSSGGGRAGQVAIGGIDKSPVLPAGFTVSNPVPTWGAGDGESTAEGEAAITRWLRHRDRLVTAEDFHDLTRRTPGVDLGRVEVLPLFNPDAEPGRQWPGMVSVLVVPRSDPLTPDAPVPDRQFLRAVCAWLDPRRLVTTELHVRGPVYRPIWVSVGIVTLPGQVPSLVEQAVATAVRTFLSPLTGGLPPAQADTCLVNAAPVNAAPMNAAPMNAAPMNAGDGTATGTGWPLGVAVRPQDIEAIATRVPGVRFVDSVLIAMTGDGGAIVSPVDSVPIEGLQLPAATVFVRSGPAADPAGLIGSAQALPPTTVPVPVVPDTC
jgi:hypothetical protein